jgi:predicted permease
MNKEKRQIISRGLFKGITPALFFADVIKNHKTTENLSQDNR